MFKGLAQVLRERMPVSLYTDEAGGRYVVMEASEYQRLTGASLDGLPQLGEVHTEPKKVVDSQAQIGNTGKVASPLASELAHMELEDEIRVDDLPL